MKRSTLLILVGVLVGVVLAGVLIASQIIGGSGANARSHASSNPTNLTNVETFTYDHSDRLTTTSLRIQLEVEAGTAAWRFTDPAGEVRWEGEAVAGDRVDERQDYTPQVGEWRLELDLQGFTGQYDTLWEGQG